MSTENNDNPHVAVVTINAIIHKKMPNGMCHPQAVHTDSFVLVCESQNEQECVEELKARIERIKESWKPK